MGLSKSTIDIRVRDSINALLIAQGGTMNTLSVLSTSELELALPELKGWSIEQGKLHCRFQFSSFIEAFGFMTSVALVAETMGHHPEWCNVYNRVSVNLTTHDAGGITMNDIHLARKMNELAASLAMESLLG